MRTSGVSQGWQYTPPPRTASWSPKLCIALQLAPSCPSGSLRPGDEWLYELPVRATGWGGTRYSLGFTVGAKVARGLPRIMNVFRSCNQAPSKKHKRAGGRAIVPARALLYDSSVLQSSTTETPTRDSCLIRRVQGVSQLATSRLRVLPINRASAPKLCPNAASPRGFAHRDPLNSYRQSKPSSIRVRIPA